MRIFFIKFIDWMILAFLFLLPWQTRWIWQQGEINGAPWEYGTYSIYATQILLWLIIIFFVINFFLKLKREFCKLELLNCYIVKLLTGLLLILLFLATVIWHSLSWEITWQYLFWMLGAMALGVVIVKTVMISKLITSLWLGGVMQGVFALWQFLSQSVPANKWLGLASHVPQDLGVSVIEFGDERWLRAYGSFGSPNSLGIYLAVCLVIGVILQLSLRAKRSNPFGSREIASSDFILPRLAEALAKRVAMTIGQIIITTGLVLSFSRSAWLATVFGLVGVLAVITLSSRAQSRDPLNSDRKGFLHSLRSVEMTNVIKQIVFILAPVVCLFIIFQPLFLARFNTDNRLEYKSVNERMGQYQEAKQIFLKYPWLGVGPGAYTLELSKMYPKAKAFELQPVHNIYMLLLVEWGIVGFVFFALLNCYIVKLLWRINKIFIPVILVLLVVGLFDHWLVTMYTGVMLWWVVWGLGLKKV